MSPKPFPYRNYTHAAKCALFITPCREYIADLKLLGVFSSGCMRVNDI